MNFASPIYAFLLFVLPFIALLKIWSDARAQKAVQAFASSDRLRQNMLGGASMVWSGLHFGLQILGLAFVIIALTRPHVGFEDENIPQSGRNIFIAIDTSKSMLADDMTPNRLTRAKLAALDLVEKLPGERIGLIAFAGRAFLQAPLTTDHDAVRESINALDHTTIPRGGSSLAAAIELALKLVEKSPGQHHGMVLFSDGQETDEGTQRAAKDAAEKHLLILPVGMGTADGSLIPDPDPSHQGEYLRDEKGNVVKTRLEAELLQKVAAITGSKYIELSTQALTRDAVDILLSQLDTQKADSRHEARPVERYQWPLGVGMFCIILSMLMRPSSRKIIKTPALPVDPHTAVHASAPVAAALVILLLSIGHTQAASVKDARKAQDAYEKGQYDEARKAYDELLKEKEVPLNPAELAYGLGAAAHQLKDYESAARAFSDALQSHNADTQKRAYKGLAGTLYNQGDLSLEKKPETTIKSWTDAREHYDSALKLFSAEKDSKEYNEIKENRDFVQKRLDDLKRKQEQKKEQQQKNEQKQKQQGNDKGQGDPKEPDDNEPQQNKDDQDQKKNEGKQEQHDAMQKPEEKLPEGQIRADENGKQPEKKPEPMDGGDNERNDKTGFSPQEARNQLRSYADDQKFDQKSWQYLQRRERPAGGKDY